MGEGQTGSLSAVAPLPLSLDKPGRPNHFLLCLLVFLDFLPIGGQLILVRNRCLLPFPPACLFRKKSIAVFNVIKSICSPGAPGSDRPGSPIPLTCWRPLWPVGHPCRGALGATSRQTWSSSLYGCTVLKTVALSCYKLPRGGCGSLLGFPFFPGPDKGQFW